MKRKFLCLICLLLVVIPCALLFSACGKEKFDVVGEWQVKQFTQNVQTINRSQYETLIEKSEEDLTEDEYNILSQSEEWFAMTLKINKDKTFSILILDEGEEYETMTGSWEKDDNKISFIRTFENGDKKVIMEFKISENNLIINDDENKIVFAKK